MEVSVTKPITYNFTLKKHSVENTALTYITYLNVFLWLQLIVFVERQVWVGCECKRVILKMGGNIC